MEDRLVIRNSENKFFLLILALVCGAVIGAVIWGFIRLMTLCLTFIWQTLPKYLTFDFYPLLVCLLGGIIIGLVQKYCGPCPDDLFQVMGKFKATGKYSYDNLLLRSGTALLPLIFGGAIGPEAGLTGIVVGLCCWAGDNWKFAGRVIPQSEKKHMFSSLSMLFGSLLFSNRVSVKDNLKTQVYVALPKAQKKLQIIFSVIGGLLIWLFLSELFGYGPGIPQFSNDFSVGVSEIIWFFPIVILSVLYGLEFEIFDKITGKLSGFIENKRFIFAVIAGLILGLSGTFVPMVMYSGEEPMRELINNSALYSAFGLLIIAAFKIPLINICIKFGWRGGIFFPAIFCGVCLGFAFAAVVPCNAVFCCAVATAALVSTITHMPFIVAALLMICFPANCFVWILGTSCLVTVLPDFVKDGKTDIKGVVLLIKLKQKVQNKINHFRDV